MRRTDMQLLIDTLNEHPGQQASPRRLAELLGWELEKVKRVAEKGDASPFVPLFIGKGGVIKHRGSEGGPVAGIYSDVARIIRDHWGPKELGLRNIDTIMTSRGGTRSEGVWSHPDMVVAADPARRESQQEPRRLHAIEVETAAGFDLRSIYQAHAQGRGANYSWVFGNTTPGVERADWDRVLWTAEELGIGLVAFEKPHAYGTYRVHLVAEHRRPTADEREAFLQRTMSSLVRSDFEL